MPALAGIPAPARPRILDFDIENRPLSYWYDGRCTAEVTAIAAKWVDSDEKPWLGMIDATINANDVGWMLSGFRHLYEQADIVTGHYILKHDLPIINGALIEYGLPMLGPKLVSDTRVHLARFSEIPKTQENLGYLMRLEARKEHMTQGDWREANRLTPEGIAETRRRVVGDVEQHVELRAALIRRGLLGAPRWWNPGGSRVAA